MLGVAAVFFIYISNFLEVMCWEIVWQVSSEDAVNMARELALKEGLMVITVVTCYSVAVANTFWDWL